MSAKSTRYGMKPAKRRGNFSSQALSPVNSILGDFRTGKPGGVGSEKIHRRCHANEKELADKSVSYGLGQVRG